MTRALCLVCVLQCAAIGTAAPIAGESEAALDKRVALFAQQMRCLVCQNETLADSQAGLAIDLRREIRTQMADGRSDAEITAFLTERYGDFVRYRPPLKPATYALWFGPFALLAGGFGLLWHGVRRREEAPEHALSAPARRRARRLLARGRR